MSSNGSGYMAMLVEEEFEEIPLGLRYGHSSIHYFVIEQSIDGFYRMIRRFSIRLLD